MSQLELPTGYGVIRNLLSQIFSRFISNIGVRLIQVPVLLSALGQDNYGRWLVLSTVPAWLALLHSGFGTVSGNQMLISRSSGDMAAVRIQYSAAWKISLFATLLLLPVIVVAFFYFPVEQWIGMATEQKWEVRSGLLLLNISILLSFYIEVISNKLKSVRRPHLVTYILSLQLWAELLLIIGFISEYPRFDFLGLANFISTIICLIAIIYFSNRYSDDIKLEMNKVPRFEVVRLFKDGMNYQALSLGNAFTLQGQMLIVYMVLGSASVAIFSTVRTLIRVASQAVELVNHSVWPEFTRLFAKGELNQAARLHRIAVFSSLVISIFVALFLGFAGIWIYHAWTGNMLPVNQSLLICFLISTPLNALWYTSSIVHLATNRYHEISRRYIFATLFSMIACFLMARAFGIQGAALSGTVADLMMIPFVWFISLRLTNDRMNGMYSRILGDLSYIKAYAIGMRQKQ